MTTAELLNNIYLALQHSKGDVLFFQAPLYPDLQGAPGSLRYPTIIQALPNDPIEDPAKVERRSEAVDVLRALYSSIQPGQRSLYVSRLIEGCSAKNAAIVVNTLVELNLASEIPRIRELKDPPMREVLAALHMKLLCQPYLFSAEDLKIVEQEAMKGIGPHPADPKTISVYPLWDAAKRVRLLRLRRELLETANAEINSDKRKVMDRAKVMGFTPALQKAMEEVDKKLAQAVSEMDFKSAIDLMRTALEEFVEESCRKVEPKTEKTAPSPGPKTKHYQPYLEYLRNVEILLYDEWETLQKFYNLLSNEGAHSLELTAEQARVYRNMSIEWLLLLTGRVQAKLKQPSPQKL